MDALVVTEIRKAKLRQGIGERTEIRPPIIRGIAALNSSVIWLSKADSFEASCLVFAENAHESFKYPGFHAA